MTTPSPATPTARCPLPPRWSASPVWEASSPVSPLTAAFLGDSREISARVDRLLSPAPPEPPHPRKYLTAAAIALTAVSAATMLHPATLESAHRLIEQLIH